MTAAELRRDPSVSAALETGGVRIPGRVQACVVVASLLGTLSRLATRSRTLLDWDPTNFALALDRLDLGQHQPHPPAAIGYVVAGRVLRVLIHDANTALVTWNVLLTFACGVLIFHFAYRAADREREACGWLAWAVLMASPLFWFYGSVAEIYVSETTLGLLVAFCCLRALSGRPHYVYGAAVALAVLGAFRITGMVFLMPLVIWACCRARLSLSLSLVRVGAVFAACLAVWFVPFLAVTGVHTYVTVLTEHFAHTATPTSVFTAPSLHTVNRHFRDAAYALLTGVGPWNALVIPVLLLTCRARVTAHRPLVLFAGLWTLPALAFYVVVHMAKFGYVLPAVPVLALVVAFYGARLPRPSLRFTLGAGQLVFGAWFFLAAHPVAGRATGESLLYRDKTLWQKALTEAGALTFPTRHTIRDADARLERVLEAVDHDCPSRQGVVLVGQDGPGANWRRLMYYVPEALSIRLPVGEDAPWDRAHDRRFDVVPARRLDVVEGCRTFWVLSADSPVLGRLRQDGILRQTDTHVFWSMGSTTVGVPGGYQLSIRHAGAPAAPATPE